MVLALRHHDEAKPGNITGGMVVRKDIGNSIQASEGDHSYNMYVGRLSSHVVLCPSTYYIVVPLNGRSYTLYPVPIIPVFQST